MSSDVNPFRYSGEYFDAETGDYYLRARYYNPRLGRFLTEDPVRDGNNWYAYCNNNPVRYVDPSGCIGVYDGRIYTDEGDSEWDVILLEDKIKYENAVSSERKAEIAAHAAQIREKAGEGNYRVNADMPLADFRQHRIIPGTYLTCRIFRHIVQKYSAIHKVLPAFFEQSDENPDGAIYAPELCGVAFIIPDMTDAINSYISKYESDFKNHYRNYIWIKEIVKTGALVDVKNSDPEFKRPDYSYHIAKCYYWRRVFIRYIRIEKIMMKANYPNYLKSPAIGAYLQIMEITPEIQSKLSSELTYTILHIDIQFYLH